MSNLQFFFFGGGGGREVVIGGAEKRSARCEKARFVGLRNHLGNEK